MDISIVVISYNSGDFLEGNLESLVTQSPGFKEIVVVDNNSTDRSVEIIRRYPAAKLIALDYNSGYAGGANMGIRNCTADLIMVANADIILHPHFTKEVVSRFSRDRELALLSPLILRFDKTTVDSAGQVPSRALYPREIGFGKPLWQVDVQEKEVFSVCGAATVFHQKALEQLAMDGEYYDEDFFIFWEDFDIGWRAHHLCLKTLLYPPAIVYHFRSATLERNFISRFSLALARSSIVKFHLVKNRYLTLIKNFRFSQHFKFIPFMVFKDIIWVTLLTISSPKIIIKLMRSGKNFSRAFARRKIIMTRSKTMKK